MYPLDAAIPYPTAAWYIAGYGREFGSSILSRKILGQSLILYRSDDGEAVVLSGVCVHRAMPLDGADLQNGSVVCPNHGYAYGRDGRCHTIPTGGPISPHAGLKRFTTVERGPFVWIWMGDPNAADIAQLPNPVDIGLGDNQPEWCVDIGVTYPMAARAALLVDNLFDLSHLAFIHANSVPGGSALCMLPPQIEVVDGRLRVARTLSDVVFEPGSLLDRMVPAARGKGAYDSVLHTEMYNPGLINAAGPWIFAREKDGRQGSAIAKLNFVHGITPETDHSTHYFGVVTRDYDIDDLQLSQLLTHQTDTVRVEDIATLEAIERSIDHNTSTRREISTKADEGAIKARHILKKQINAELVP